MTRNLESEVKTVSE